MQTVRKRTSGCTVIQTTLKIGQKYSTVPQAQKRVRERVSEQVSSVEEVNEQADKQVAQY